MRIQYLGHAGFSVHLDSGTNILLDPWFHGAFLGAWFPWPNNLGLMEHVYKKHHYDYLYVSHTHEDHFDAAFLEDFDKSVKVICPDYRSKSLARKFGKLGFTNLIELPHGGTYQVDGLRMTVFMDTSHKEDSGLLVEAGGVSFLDLNDCNPKLDDLPSGVTYLAAQYSGASWYPNCYDYPAEVMSAKVAEVRTQFMESLCRKVAATKPGHYIPSAGPACFLDPTLRKFNDRQTTIFPTWEDVADDFAAKSQVSVLHLQAEDWVQADGSVLRMNLRPQGLEEYAEERRGVWDHSTRAVTVTTDEVAKYFTDLAVKNRHLLTVPKTFTVAAESGAWTVLVSASGARVTEGAGTVGYRFAMPGWVLAAIIDGNATWEDALLSMRVSLSRTPDVYDETLMGLLRYGSETVQTNQMMLERQCSEKVSRGGFLYQRFCPHAGEDLSDADITGNVITCPRHYWKWDLETGECLKGGTVRLEVCDV